MAKIELFGIIEGVPAGLLWQDAHIPGMDELREHLLKPVAQNCDRTLALLS